MSQASSNQVIAILSAAAFLSGSKFLQDQQHSETVTLSPEQEAFLSEVTLQQIRSASAGADTLTRFRRGLCMTYLRQLVRSPCTFHVDCTHESGDDGDFYWTWQIGLEISLDGIAKQFVYIDFDSDLDAFDPEDAAAFVKAFGAPADTGVGPSDIYEILIELTGHPHKLQPFSISPIATAAAPA